MLTFALKFLAPLLVLVAVVQGCTHQARQIDKLKAKVAEAQAASDANYKAAEGWRRSFDASEQARKVEADRAQTDLAAKDRTCADEKASLRTSWEKRSKVYAKPVAMKAGCPVRELVAASDLGLK